MPSFYFENKKISYKETGCGEPLVLLHEDTASGRMFLAIGPKPLHVVMRRRN
jgi:hypothetical protein